MSIDNSVMPPELRRKIFGPRYGEELGHRTVEERARRNVRAIRDEAYFRTHTLQGAMQQVDEAFRDLGHALLEAANRDLRVIRGLFP